MAAIDLSDPLCAGMIGPLGEERLILFGLRVHGSAPFRDGNTGHEQCGAGQIGNREPIAHEVATGIWFLGHVVERIARDYASAG
jgi:hypothetical protein